MSAIGLIFNRNGAPIDPQSLAILGAGLDRLGPDGGHELVNGSIGVAYRAFHTTCESHFEMQPVVLPQGDILTMDGIIFNRAELLSLLHDDIRGDSTDIGLISVGLEKHGEEFLSRVIGNFALAWWQARNQRLVLARDPFGIRPLFYYYDEARVIIASDLKALIDVEGTGLKIDEEYVAEYLALFPNPQRTPYKNFHAVEPGNVVEISIDGLQMHRLWSLGSNREIRYQKDEDYEKHLLCLLREGVRCCLRTDDRPVWSALSGGLDSSSIVCIADQLIGKGEAEASRLETFSVVYSDSATADERKFIHLVEKNRGEVGFHIQEDEYWMDFPPPENSFLCTPNPLHLLPRRTARISEGMGKSRARVMLDGHGGDQVFWNTLDASPELADLLAQGRLPALHSRLRAWSQSFKKTYTQLLLREALLPLLPSQVGVWCQPKARIAPWLNPEFVKRLHLREISVPTQDPFSFWAPSRRIHSRAIHEAIWHIASGIYQELIRVEMRHPLLYQPLVEFMLAIPFEQKLRPGETRSLMRRALREILPTKILGRKDKGVVGEALNRGLFRERARLQQLFTGARVCEYGYAERDTLHATLQLATHGGKVNLSALVHTISLELWLRSVEHYCDTRVSSTRGVRECLPEPALIRSINAATG